MSLSLTLPPSSGMSDHLPFTRRLKELIVQETQGEVANRLGYTPPRVSQIARGERPSREFVERLITAYDLPREEWLAMAGFGPKADPADEREEIANRAADKAVQKLLGYQTDSEEVFWREVRQSYHRLQAEGVSMLLPAHSIDWATITPEQAVEMARELERQARREAGRS